jgi:hypothetical protein
VLASFDHEDSVNHVAFSPDGTRVLTGSEDRTAKLWDVASGKLISVFSHQGAVRCANFSPDGLTILTASADNTAKLWDVASGKLIAIFTHQDTVRSAVFSPDGAWILTASADQTAQLWDNSTAAALAGQGSDPRPSKAAPPIPLPALSDVASGLRFSDEGSLVAVDEPERAQLFRQLNAFAAGDDPEARFLRWFLGTGGTRTVFPASDTKVADWIDDALLTNPDLTEGWLRNALLFLPDNALLHFGLAKFETDSGRADFLRSFGLAALPKNSVLCVRAAKMLLDQNQPALALAAIDKGLLVDKTNSSAEHLRLKILDSIPK